MTLCIRSSLILLITLILTSCGDTDNAEPPAELVEFEPSLQINELWSVNTGDGVEQQYLKLYPLIVEDKIIVADRDGDIAAYDLASGDTVWDVDLDMPLSGGIGGDSEHLVVTSRNGHVVMLDAQGGLLWKVDASSEVLMPAQIAAGLVIIRSVDGRISALNVKDGKQQ